MAARALAGVVGLESLERSGRSTFSLGLILAAASFGLIAALTLVVFLIEGAVEPDFFVLWLGTMMFLYLFAAVLISRWLEHDLELLGGTFDVQGQKTVYFYLTLAISAPTVWFVMHIIDTDVGINVLDRFDIVITAGTQEMVLWFVLIPVSAIMSAPFNLVLIREIFTLHAVAKLVSVDLFDMNPLQAISNPLVRMFVLVCLFVATLPVVSYLDNFSDVVIARISMFFLVVLTPLILLYLYPVFIVRNRVKVLKEAELQEIDDAFKRDETPSPDLMTRRMFIESRPEWPITSNVQRLLLFGFLPPFTWVLAAVVENALY